MSPAGHRRFFQGTTEMEQCVYNGGVPAGFPHRGGVGMQDRRCQKCGGAGQIQVKTIKGLEYPQRCPCCNGRGYGYATK